MKVKELKEIIKNIPDDYDIELYIQYYDKYEKPIGIIRTLDKIQVEDSSLKNVTFCSFTE